MKKSLIFSVFILMFTLGFSQIRVYVNPNVFNKAATRAFGENIIYVASVISNEGSSTTYLKTVALPNHRVAKFYASSADGLTLKLGRVYLKEGEWETSREFEMFYVNGAWKMQSDDLLNLPKVKKSFKKYYRGLRRYGRYTYYWQ
jgi:hypothetical protein